MKMPLPRGWKDRLRPVYQAGLNALNPEGTAVAVNGVDPIRLSEPYASTAEKHEPDVWVKLMGAVRPGDTCVDVGASIGLYTLGFASRLSGSGRVFSFEPDIPSYQILQRHIALNNCSQHVCAMNVAVSDTNGVLKFVTGLGPTSHAAGPGEEAPCVSVAGFCLDSIFPPMGIVPDVMKIDVEGFELQVLKGAGAILSHAKRPRMIYLDVHPWAWPQLGLDTTAEALRHLLEGHGYRVEMRNDEYADIFAVSNA